MATAREKKGFDERFREVTGRTYILTLLQNLVKRKILVSVFLPESDFQYTSTVLSIDPQSSTLQLDELFPQSGHALLESARQLRLFAHLGGAALGFTTELEEVESEDGLYYYRLRLPGAVNYLQRRDDHRVVVTKLGIKAELYDHKGKVHKAILHDISTGGISLIVPQSEAFHSSGVYRCTLHLPGEGPFHCKVDLCCKRSAIDNGEILGGSFVGLESKNAHALRRVVAELERRLLRLRWEPVATTEQPED